jgi:hypothetical protein
MAAALARSTGAHHVAEHRDRARRQPALGTGVGLPHRRARPAGSRGLTDWDNPPRSGSQTRRHTGPAVTDWPATLGPRRSCPSASTVLRTRRIRTSPSRFHGLSSNRPSGVRRGFARIDRRQLVSEAVVGPLRSELEAGTPLRSPRSGAFPRRWPRLTYKGLAGPMSTASPGAGAPPQSVDLH